jgi:hypothetical protein
MKHLLRINGTLIRCYEALDTWSIATLYNLSPALLARIRYRALKGQWPDFKNPMSFDEKLLWLNLYWRHPLKTRCGDKYTMRSYVADHGLGNVLPNLLGVYENIDDIDFAALPQRFVLKCTHGCGFNIVCKDKSKLNIEESKHKLYKWMKIDFAKRYGETHYADMTARIICEEFLGDPNSDLPTDYKLFCFSGKTHCTMVCTRRMSNGRAQYDFYDLEWKIKLAYSKTSLRASRDIPKPAAYKQMIAAAETLSKPFPFVRMDFYSVQGKAILGEMTFTPAGCIDIGLTDLAQRVMGELIELPNKPLNKY